MVKHKEAISMEKAVCYVRVSTMEQATQGVSLEAQEEKLRAYCQMTGLEIVKIIKEEGISATKPLKDRPGGKELIEIINKKQANHVVTLKLDRLFRNAEDALHVTNDWDSKGVTLHLVDMGGQAINTKSAIRFPFLIGTVRTLLLYLAIEYTIVVSIPHRYGKNSFLSYPYIIELVSFHSS